MHEKKNYPTIYMKPKSNDDGEVFEMFTMDGDVYYRYIDKYELYYFIDQQSISLGIAIEVTEDQDSDMMGLFRNILN